eukprot:TRINITY_DN4647_c0_g2_i3.p1 TRINITY_DN4647_c0_g2~~TRINITY_DN4647_c0_g2_i3.p1  ORF type:complete len:500 (+),score=173.95 TRINITY_DN4647_c0_g2_i3:615-2114(+)
MSIPTPYIYIPIIIIKDTFSLFSLLSFFHNFIPEFAQHSSHPSPSLSPPSFSLVNKLIAKSRLVELETDLDVKHSDPNSPLFAAKSWAEMQTEYGFSDALMKAVAAQNYLKPSKIQSMGIPMMLSDPPKNMIAQAQAGTGKTCCFVLSALARLDMSVQTPQVLIVANARELAIQIADEVESMSEFMDPRPSVLTLVKGVDVKEATDAQIIVGSAGTVTKFATAKSGVLPLKKLKLLVLDEADSLVYSSWKQVMQIKSVLPKSTQIALFSATFNNKVRKNAMKYVEVKNGPEPNIIQVPKKELDIDQLKQYYIDCNDNGEDLRLEVVKYLFPLASVSQSIIFCEARNSAIALAEALNADGYSTEALTAGKDGSERDDMVKRFRNQEFNVLIATNVIARGFDIPSVALVINYDMPLTYDRNNKRTDEVDEEMYLHRIGRTARFGRKGTSITLVYNKLSNQHLQVLQKSRKHPIEEIELGKLEDMDYIGQFFDIGGDDDDDE